MLWTSILWCGVRCGGPTYRHIFVLDDCIFQFPINSIIGTALNQQKAYRKCVQLAHPVTRCALFLTGILSKRWCACSSTLNCLHPRRAFCRTSCRRTLAYVWRRTEEWISSCNQAAVLCYHVCWWQVGSNKAYHFLLLGVEGAAVFFTSQRWTDFFACRRVARSPREIEGCIWTCDFFAPGDNLL